MTTETQTVEAVATGAQRRKRMWLRSIIGGRAEAWSWWAAALLLALAGTFWVWVNRIPDHTLTELRTPAPAVGHPAPDFVTHLLDDSAFALHQQRGTPLILNFWATWCGPCRAEMPALQRTAERYAGHVTIVGINQAEAPAVIQTFVDQFGITFPIALDADQTIGATFYNVRGLPTTYFIDGDGIIRSIWMGEMNSVTLEEGIAEILQ